MPRIIMYHSGIGMRHGALELRQFRQEAPEMASMISNSGNRGSRTDEHAPARPPLPVLWNEQLVQEVLS
jgi:hypothetical protein